MYKLPTLSKHQRGLPFALLFALIGIIFLVRSFAAGSGSITGNLFDDANRNGIMDAGETPFSGKGMALYRQDSTWVAGTVTDSSGKFNFSGLDDGNYYVAANRSVWIELRADWVPSSTGSIEYEIPVNLVGSKNVNFGLRKIVRSRTIGQPISAMTSPNGMLVESYNDAVTAQQVFDALSTGSLRGGEEKFTKIRFDYQSSAFCSTSQAGQPGSFNSYSANCWIDWLGWTDSGDQVLFHEYGHAWSMYYDHIIQQDGTFSRYLEARGLSGDSRIGTSVYWSPAEMIAEDFRQLYGSENAKSFAQANKDIPLAKDVPNLDVFLRTTYMASTSDTVPPSIPTGVAAQAESPTQVSLTWSASSDNGVVKQYEVYRDDVLVYTINAPSTTAFDTSLSPYTTYRYFVKARDAAGNLSGASTTVSITTPGVDNIAPNPPTGLMVVSVNKTSVSLKWGASTDNASTVTYRIYTNVVGKRAQPKLIATTSNINFVVSGLKSGTSYSYWVTAVDASGNESMPSNAVTAKTSR